MGSIPLPPPRIMRTKQRQLVLFSLSLFFLCCCFFTTAATTTTTTATSSFAHTPDDVRVLSDLPYARIFQIDNFLSEEETAYMMDKAHRSLKANKFSTNDETGISYEMPIDNDAVLEGISRRQYELVGTRNKQHGTYRVRRYVKDKYHPIHTDTYKIDGQTLVAAMIMYLTDVEEGGETFFPNANKSRNVGKGRRRRDELFDHFYPEIDYSTRKTLDSMLHVRPKRGRLAVWLACDQNGRDGPLSVHGSWPITKGTKWTYGNFVYLPKHPYCKTIFPSIFPSTQAFLKSQEQQHHQQQQQQQGNKEGSGSSISGAGAGAGAGTGGVMAIKELPLVTPANLTDKRVHLVSNMPGPRLAYVEEFITEEENEHLLKLAEAAMKAGKFEDNDVTGVSYEMPIDTDPVLRRIADREYELLGSDNDEHGTMRVRRYLKGNYHPLHTDSYQIGQNTLVASMLIYLNTPGEGGETVFPNVHKPRPSRIQRGNATFEKEYFPELDLEHRQIDPNTVAMIKPRPRTLAIWLSCAPSGADDVLSVHGSMPLMSGVKWTFANFVYKPRTEYCHKLAPNVFGVYEKPPAHIGDADAGYVPSFTDDDDGSDEDALLAAAGRGDKSKNNNNNKAPASDEDEDAFFRQQAQKDAARRAAPMDVRREVRVERLGRQEAPANIWVVHDFVTPDEEQELLQYVYAKRKSFTETEFEETGNAAELEIIGEPLLERLSARQYAFLNLRNEQHYTFRARKLGVGQHLPFHIDAFDVGQQKLAITMVLRLGGGDTQGGHDVFPWANMPRERIAMAPFPEYTSFDWTDDSQAVRADATPRSLLIYMSCTPDGEDDSASLHGTSPILSGHRVSLVNYVYVHKKYCASLPARISAQTSVGGGGGGGGGDDDEVGYDMDNVESVDDEQEANNNDGGGGELDELDQRFLKTYDRLAQFYQQRQQKQTKKKQAVVHEEL